MQSRLMTGMVSPAAKLGQSHQIKALPCQNVNFGSRRNSILRFASKGGSSQAGEGDNGTQLEQLDDYFNKLSLTISTSEDDAIGKDRIGMVDSAAAKYNKIRDLVADATQATRYENTGNNKINVTFFSEDKFKSVPSESEDSDFSLINILVAINIAVLLFETASPIRADDLDEYVSLPFFYGAKVNKLILLGEWWRLLTPMFLHTGFFHVVLGCWGLLTFGPRVCRAYGPVTFFLIYLLGGICGNFTSFLHTPELTVCGTGPLFAIIGAWLIYQVQNKDAIPKDVLESMFQRAVLVTLLSFILSCFGGIDNWSHLGATLSGLAYGYFTCPSLELDNANSASKEGQKEGVALLQRQSSPCKSVAIFTISVFLLTSLVVLYGMQPELLDFE